MGARRVRVETTIGAPLAAVWGVLVDFTRYPEWNPFTTRVETTGRVGARVLMDVRLGKRRLRMRERVRVNEPMKRIGWGLYIGGGRLLDCTRVQELAAIDERTTRYTCEEAFRGWLVPLFFGWTERAMHDGFAATAAALKRRAEELTA